MTFKVIHRHFVHALNLRCIGLQILQHGKGLTTIVMWSLRTSNKHPPFWKNAMQYLEKKTTTTTATIKHKLTFLITFSNFLSNYQIAPAFAFVLWQVCYLQEISWLVWHSVYSTAPSTLDMGLILCILLNRK